MASQRPSSGRPGTRGTQTFTATRQAAPHKPPQTALRVGTGAGPRAGSFATPGVLSSHIKVAERPVTQHGVSGMKTAIKGPQRQILDKSYYLGLLRSKINELTTECSKIQKEIDNFNQENSVYLSYEKRAETLADEIKDLQGQLADCNMLVDKLNTNTEMEDMMNDFTMLKTQNDREAQIIDVIFTERRQKEEVFQLTEGDIVGQKQAAESIVKKMPIEKQEKFAEMQKINEDLLQDLEAHQQELDTLNTERENLEAEIANSNVKKEAVLMHEKLQQLQQHKNGIVAEDKTLESPQEERERLLRQVKDDNHKISSMDRQVTEIHEKISHISEEVQQLDVSMDEHQGEREQKYRELKKREESMDNFLDTFEDAKDQELQQSQQTHASILAILEHSCRMINNMQQISSITPDEFKNIQMDLNFKEKEMFKSQSTAKRVSSESQQLQQDLQKVQQLESKINTELRSLKQQILQMTEGLQAYSQLDSLKAIGDQKKKSLQEKQNLLLKRKETFRIVMQTTTQDYEGLKTQLHENETHAQLTNLQRKWQHHEQNNFVMKEFIGSKGMECDYKSVVMNVSKQLLEYNRTLSNALHSNIN